MAITFRTLKDAFDHGFDTLIDVRSPSEFAEDHIPGAINLPALSDGERARVGTIYVQESPFKARKLGAALVARNAARHLEGPLAEKPGGWRPLVYCWRGGQRSGSLASILSQIGWRTETVQGGYQSYRRLVVSALYDTVWPGRVVLLDGNTGTGKTELLARLRECGVQALDLEGLACHRGSVLGTMTEDQPSQKEFESGIAKRMSQLDPERPLLVEAESSKIGDRIIPPSLWEAMRAAPRIQVSAPLEARVRFLVTAYGDAISDVEGFSERLRSLVPYHGRAQVEVWVSYLRSGEMDSLARELIAVHYDPRYAKSRGRSEAATVASVATEDLSSRGLDATADRIKGLLRSL